jgi:hypothetical protein
MIDPEYPRSSRLRAYLQARGQDQVTICSPATEGRFLRQACTDLLRLLRTCRHGDVILLAEMQLKFAPVTLLVGAVRRCPVVVDGFIGLHETLIEDWRVAPRRSFRAWRYRMQDRMARRGASLFLTDTETRADAVRVTDRPVAPTLSLPVGAPAWATPTPPPARAEGGPLRVLYYGNYIPLHGVPTIVDAIGLMHTDVPIEVTFLGGGAQRTSTERMVQERGLSDTIAFADPVPEAALATVIAEHHVVLGVFGGSPKAGSVIANKVWQGLACSRQVITRSSAALDEIREIAGPLLTEVRPSDSAALASALSAAASEPTTFQPDIATRLEGYTDARWASLSDVLEGLS